jgi:hypothetical protein
MTVESGFNFWWRQGPESFAHGRDKTLWSLQHSSNKNKKDLILFLRTLKRSSEIFYLYPWGDPANFRNCQVRASDKRRTTLLEVSEIWRRGILQISTNVHEKSAPSASAGRISFHNICAYVPKTQHLIPLWLSPPIETEIWKAFNILFECLLCNLKPWCW